MPRSPRKKSGTGIYHIMQRGADRRIIFSDDEDCIKFLNILKDVKEKSGFKLYAYCLMGNHLHLLLKEESEPLDLIFKRAGSAYVYYYNWKYQLHGHLFQDRFRSEQVESDAYFMDVLRYIWQNPLKAGLCESPSDYPWLGCSGITKGDMLLDSIESMTNLKGQSLVNFVNEECEGTHLEDTGMLRLTDREAIERLKIVCKCDTVQEIGGWEVKRRDSAVLAALNNGVSIRQLARITGISKTVIERIRKQ